MTVPVISLTGPQIFSYPTGRALSGDLSTVVLVRIFIEKVHGEDPHVKIPENKKASPPVLHELTFAGIRGIYDKSRGALRSRRSQPETESCDWAAANCRGDPG